MGPVVLLILDGWGLAPKNKANAIEFAHKPNFDYLWKHYPHTQLMAHGKYVGLPNNQVGNSEAGHMNIGGGRIIKQDSVLISEAIADGRFYKNTAINNVIEVVNKNKSRLHLMGLVSDNESPHVDLDHLYALVDLAYMRGVKDVFLHLFTDGRDSKQFATIKIINNILQRVEGQAKVVSLIGRYYSMDRGKNWDRTEKTYECLVSGKGLFFKEPHDALTHAYNQNKTDEYIEPTIIASTKAEGLETRIKNHDGVIFFNLRSDRARQLTKPFVQTDFNKKNPGSFVRKHILKNIAFCTLTDFGPDLDSIDSAFPSADIRYTLPIILSQKKQLYMAETEKYAHVTYFINGGYADKVDGEDRLHIHSDVIMSYATKPGMKVEELTQKVVSFLQKKQYDFITLNFANPDMVGHTGDFNATVKAIEAVDECLGIIYQEVLKQEGTLIVTADHGNAEKMIDLETNEIWGGHTTNPVPFMLVCNNAQKIKLRSGVLGDIAPTIYEIMKITELPSMLNKSLILK